MTNYLCTLLRRSSLLNLCRFGRIALLLALAVLTSSTFCLAEVSYTAGKVQFNQRGLFTEQQLEAAAGLHPGSSFTANDLSAAAQRLVDTGYFDDVGAALEGRDSAITIRFDVKPTPTSRMLHVGFENFVWLTHDEIEAAIHAKLPLFIDYLPEESPNRDIIKAALISALAAKSVTATVAYDTVEPTLRHPIREIEFRVTNPSVRVANIKLSGVSTDLVPYIQKSVNATARTDYSEGPADETTADRILAPLLDAGYIEATLTGASPAPTPAADGSIGIVLSATLNPGEIYHLSSISFAGTPLLSASDFASAATLHPGDVASRAALLKTLQPIDDAYRKQGYMDVVITATPHLDRVAHQVAYDVTVEPGEQYHVHQVVANNLDAAARADFDRGFLMTEGKLYSPTYVAGFLRANTALLALSGYSAKFRAYANPNDHTVDVVIDFVRGPQR